MFPKTDSTFNETMSKSLQWLSKLNYFLQNVYKLFLPAFRIWQFAYSLPISPETMYKIYQYSSSTREESENILQNL